MASRILQPPSNKHLGDILIAHVKPRDRPLQWGESHPIRSVKVPSNSERINPFESVETTFPAYVDTRECQSTTEATLPMKPTPDACVSDSRTNEAKRALRKALRREKQREGMVRLRKRQKNWAIQLEEDTRQLRVEVRKIEQRRSDIVSGIPTKNNLWSVVAEFFRLFRYGIPPLDLLTPTVQMDFARATMAPNVRCGQERRGAEAVVDAWCRLSCWFSDVEVKLQRLDKHSDSLVVATTVTSLTITERTLCNVFPHLWVNAADKREDTLSLARRLLGEQIVLQGSVAFEWDSGYGRITSITTASDMLTPILKLVGSLENASHVFEHSLISPDFQW